MTEVVAVDLHCHNHYYGIDFFFKKMIRKMRNIIPTKHYQFLTVVIVFSEKEDEKYLVLPPFHFKRTYEILCLILIICLI